MVFDPITKVIDVATADQLRNMVRDEIDEYPTIDNLHQRNYRSIYETLLRHISVNPDADKADLERIPNPDGTYDLEYTRTWLFIKQVVNINDPQAEISSTAVRNYTHSTYQTFFGKEYNDEYSNASGTNKDTWVQAISNAIADGVFRGMLGGQNLDKDDTYVDPIPRNSDGTTAILSPLEEIVTNDAVAAARGFYKNPNFSFNDDNNHPEYGIWAGNPFFIGAGVADAFNSHILHDGGHDYNDNDTDLGDTYDLLALMKAIFIVTGQAGLGDAFELFSANVADAQSSTEITNTVLGTMNFLLNAYGRQGLVVFEDSLTQDIVIKFSNVLLDYLFDDGSAVDEELITLSDQFVLGTVYAEGDNLTGTGNAEIIHGGKGTDTIVASEGNDLIDGGYDYDIVDYEVNDDRIVATIENLGNSFASRTASVEKYEDNFLEGVPNFDVLYHIEKIIGSSKDDHFKTVNAKDDLTLTGGDGVDTYEFFGNFGNNVIIEDNGGVLLIDGKALTPSADGTLLSVGYGNNIRVFEWERSVNYTPPDGVEVLRDHHILTEVDSGGNPMSNSITILDYFDNRDNWNFVIGEYNVKIGNSYGNYMWGSVSQHDWLVGKGGMDGLYGNGGSDVLIGGAWSDILRGGSGNDTFKYLKHSDSTFSDPFNANQPLLMADQLMDFTAGEDKIDVTGLGFSGITTLGNGGTYDLEYEILGSDLILTNEYYQFQVFMAGIDVLTESDFLGLATESLDLVGDYSDNEIIGGDFDDTITGFGGDDVIELRGGNDVVDGGTGNGDKVKYSAVAANYAISDNFSQTITVTDNVGSDGVDSLTNVEVLQFSDTTLYWDGASWGATIPDAAPNALGETVSTNYEAAVTIDVLFNDSDAEDDILDNSNLSINTNPSNGSVNINNSGTITYTPNTGFSGSDSFVYTLTDSAGGTDTATVNITVGAAPANDAPDAVNDTVTVAYETATILSVLANDTDDESLDGGNITIDADPVSGTVVVNTDGTITYTPDAAYDGTDSFDYTITDAAGNVDTATVSITVNPEPSNYAPTADADTATMLMGDTVDIDVLANDTDVEDTSFAGSNLSIDTAPEHGSVSIQSNGVITFTPNRSYVGTDSFTYTLTDSGGESSTAIVNVSVLADIDPNATATHTGDANDNYIKSASANDTLLGLDGNDILYGVAGDDQLVGGLGDDTLWGYSGNDTYIWAAGDGNDLVQESNVSGSGTDILHFTGGIVLSDLEIYGYTSHDLKIKYIPTGEILTLQNQLYSDTDYSVETLTFDDGSSYNLMQGMKVQGNASNETLYGTVYDDTMRGGQGDDVIDGETGNDTLYGDIGNDTVYGGIGDDTYVWRIGDGDDLLIESNSGGTDTLLLTGGITLNDVKVYGYTSHDMRVEYVPTGETLTLQNLHYSDADYRIESITFDDGTSYNLDQAALWLGGVGSQNLQGSVYNDTMRGGKDNDTVNGGAGDDTLYGDLGDDVVYGGTGDDTYIWEAGRGNDIFVESNSGGTDTLYLKGGITLSDLHIYGYTSHDLRIEYIPTGEILTLQNLHYSDTDYHIETLRFDDGATYDLQTGVQWLGGVGSQHLQGSIYDDVMNGGKDNDTLSGDAGNDTLSGDLGNDSLKGSYGDDMYLWKAGDGNDIFAEHSSSGSTNDVVFLTGGITLADLDMYGTTSHDVKIVHTPTGETITLQNHLYSDVDYHFEFIRFEDGTTYNLEQGYEIRGGTGNDNLDGGAYDDTMLGDLGNDILEGFAGNDVFEGGAGGDRLYGGTGDDVYLWASGDGNDWIYEQNYTGSGSDTLHLTGGIVAADVTFSQTGNDLLVNYTPTGESIRIDNHYLSDPDYKVETLLFDNGTTVDLLGV